MGLNPRKKIPIGFCFLRYKEVEPADRAVLLLNNSILDERIIRVDKDSGKDLETNRKFARGN